MCLDQWGLIVYIMKFLSADCFDLRESSKTRKLIVALKAKQHSLMPIEQNITDHQDEVPSY